jgi:hypothetical protein
MSLLRIILFLIVLPFSGALHAEHPVRHVAKVVLWGHKLHTHTHSYIHWGFSRAFAHLGYATYWFDQHDDLSTFDFANTLFITEGQVDAGIPIRDDCYYIIHNCRPEKYRPLLANGHALILQVYTHDCLKRNDPALAFCFHYDLTQPIIYMPWATDLLPYEIEAIQNKLHTLAPRKKLATFVGSIATGTFGNQSEIMAFKRAMSEHGIEFHHGGVNNKSMDQNIQMMQSALLAPALQGAWQCEHGYIPCRIFKNISYGAMGITNSDVVYQLFDKKIVYNANAYQLGHDAIARAHTWTITDQQELMNIVKTKHTYLNRIELLFQFFEMIATQKGVPL